MARRQVGGVNGADVGAIDQYGPRLRLVKGDQQFGSVVLPEPMRSD